MTEINHQKLVRDKIPEIIKADGREPITRILDDAEYKRALLEKAVEEAKELLESGGSLGERADLAEVLRELDELEGFTPEAIDAARTEKSELRGGFMKRIFLEREVIND